MIRKRIPLRERLERRVVKDPESGCWLWQGRFHSGRRWAKGAYGVLSIPTGKRGARPEAAHRVAYQIYVGPIPEGLWVLHRCDNTRCCNPEHLYAGSREDNVSDCVTRGRNYIPSGELNGNAKLNKNDASVIRRMAWLFRLPRKQIATEYGISSSHANRIIRGLQWGI